MHIHRPSGKISHYQFSDMIDLLSPGDLLVVNNTKVVPARLHGKKETGGKVEILIIDYASGMQHLEANGSFQCDCLIKASKRPKVGSELLLEKGVKAKVISHKESITEIRFLNGASFPSYLEKEGELPLPHYIKRDDQADATNDHEDYQTVYANQKGAVAAPTAGLHFTKPLLAELMEKGIDITPITLHVGYGTFVPVRVADIREHDIHSEFFSISSESADKINQAKTEKRRVIAVGTTSVRTLEFAADENGTVQATTGVCDLFIYPGYSFTCVDAMLTNFHLPESTLLMLVSAFYEREKMLAAYAQAIDSQYRFFSYGDAMFIE